MKEKKRSSLEKIGYIDILPEGADLDDYEKIHIINKKGEKCILYRSINHKKKIDEISDFSESWNTFKSFL